jgi:hypothetical protein
MCGVRITLGNPCREEEPPAQVQEDDPLLHRREFLLPDEVPVFVPSIDVDRDNVGTAQEFLEGVLSRVPQGEFLLEVVISDLHPERLGEDGKLGADIPVADDPQPFPPDLVEPRGGLRPDAAVEPAAGLDHPSQEQDHFAQRHLDDAARIAVGSMEDRDALCVARGKIDLFRADAECSDRRQARGPLKDVGSDAGLRTDPQDGHVLHHPGEHFFRGALGNRLHLEPRILEYPDGSRVDVLQEECFHGGHYTIHGGRPVPAFFPSRPEVRVPWPANLYAVRAFLSAPCHPRDCPQ